MFSSIWMCSELHFGGIPPHSILIKIKIMCPFVPTHSYAHWAWCIIEWKNRTRTHTLPLTIETRIDENGPKHVNNLPRSKILLKGNSMYRHTLFANIIVMSLSFPIVQTAIYVTCQIPEKSLLYWTVLSISFNCSEFYISTNDL